MKLLLRSSLLAMTLFGTCAAISNGSNSLIGSILHPLPAPTCPGTTTSCVAR